MHTDIFSIDPGALVATYSRGLGKYLCYVALPFVFNTLALNYPPGTKKSVETLSPSLPKGLGTTLIHMDHIHNKFLNNAHPNGCNTNIWG